MDLLTILALCVGDGHCLILAYENTIVAYLTTHLTIERSVVEYKLEICVLLLCHLAIAQDMALVLSVIVAYELLLIGRAHV